MTEEEFTTLRNDPRFQQRLEYQVKSFWHPGEYISFSRSLQSSEGGAKGSDHSFGPISDVGPSSHLTCPNNQRRFWLAGGFGSMAALANGLLQWIRTLPGGKPLNYYEVCMVRYLAGFLRKADRIRAANFKTRVPELLRKGQLGGVYTVKQHGNLPSAVYRKKTPDSWQSGRNPASKEGAGETKNANS